MVDEQQPLGCVECGNELAVEGETKCLECLEQEHAYLSTYCYHGEHERCRLTCKVCGQPCLCLCHTNRVHSHRLHAVPAAPSEPCRSSTTAAAGESSTTSG